MTSKTSKTMHIPGSPKPLNSRWRNWLPLILGFGPVSEIAAGSPMDSGVQGMVAVLSSCPGPQREGVNCEAGYPNVEILLLSTGGATVGRSTRAGLKGCFGDGPG